MQGVHSFLPLSRGHSISQAIRAIRAIQQRFPLEQGAFNPRVSVEARVLNFNGNLGEAGGIQFTSFFEESLRIEFRSLERRLVLLLIILSWHAEKINSRNFIQY